MGLNIKNEKAHVLANQLSRLTGESLTQVVISSLELRLAAEQGKRREGKAQRILDFASRFAAGVDPQLRSSDHGESLYGEDGLPR